MRIRIGYEAIRKRTTYPCSNNLSVKAGTARTRAVACGAGVNLSASAGRGVRSQLLPPHEHRRAAGTSPSAVSSHCPLPTKADETAMPPVRGACPHAPPRKLSLRASRAFDEPARQAMHLPDVLACEVPGLQFGCDHLRVFLTDVPQRVAHRPSDVVARVTSKPRQSPDRFARVVAKVRSARPYP